MAGVSACVWGCMGAPSRGRSWENGGYEQTPHLRKLRLATGAPSRLRPERLAVPGTLRASGPGPGAPAAHAPAVCFIPEEPPFLTGEARRAPQATFRKVRA